MEFLANITPPSFVGRAVELELGFSGSTDREPNHVLFKHFASAGCGVGQPGVAADPRNRAFGPIAGPLNCAFGLITIPPGDLHILFIVATIKMCESSLVQPKTATVESGTAYRSR